MNFPSLICNLGATCNHCVDGSESDSDGGDILCSDLDCVHCYLTESEFESESESESDSDTEMGEEEESDESSDSEMGEEDDGDEEMDEDMSDADDGYEGGDESEDDNCGEKLLECNSSDEEGGDVFEI